MRSRILVSALGFGISEAKKKKEQQEKERKKQRKVEKKRRKNSQEKIKKHHKCRHSIEHCSMSSTATTAPADPSNQGYECCECFLIFEDVILGRKQSELSEVVGGGFMLIISMTLL